MAPRKQKRRKLRPAPLSPATEAFLRQDEYAFQRVCAEAYNHEPDVDRCSIYGTRGQKQHGIDLLAYLRNSGEIELVQCRRYSVFGVDSLEDAIHDFLAEWKRWKKENVRRFVVVTSADISDRELQDAILAERRRFRRRKIIFDVWGCHELCSKLNPHRAAVLQIYGGDGSDRICGVVPETAAWRATERLIRDHVGNALVELEGERSAQLEGLRELSREGRHEEALKQALTIRQGAAWAGHSPELRARFLRFEAAMRLNLGEPVAEPCALVELAKALHPQNDYQVIDAYIVAHRDGIAQALLKLDPPRSIDACNMRLALLLEQGRTDEIFPEFKVLGASLTPNAETHRVLALAALLAGDLAIAQKEIALAQAQGPKHRSIRLAAAIIDYRTCIVKSSDAGANLRWPTPVRWEFVRRDPASLNRLRRSSSEFAALQVTASTNEIELLQVWELGCLACDPTRAIEAEAFVKARLQEAPDRFHIAAWAVERDYVFDRTVVATAIAAAIHRDPKIDLDAHFARCAVLLADNKVDEAERALDEAETAFASSGNHNVWKLQKIQFLARNGRQTAKLINSIKDPNQQRQARLAALLTGRSGRTKIQQLAKYLAEEYAKSDQPSLLFQACDAYFRAGKPQFIAEHARELVDRVATDAALRLALHGAFAAEKPELCLELLREKQALLQGGALSPELRRLHAACLEKRGQLEEAIRMAEAVYSERPEPRTFADFFRILILAGDTPRAAILARDLLTLPKADVMLLLQTANIARLHDLKLAQQLWRKAAAKPLRTTNLLVGVVSLAFTLGTEHEAGELQQRLFSRAKRNKGSIQVKTLDEVRDLFRQRQEQSARLSVSYDRSEAPIHLIAPPVGAPLVQLYHEKLLENRTVQDLTRLPTLFARYGARTLREQSAQTVLFADITGLILAADLKILGLVEEHLAPIFIAPETQQSLVEQVGQCRPLQPSQHTWRAELLQFVAAGEIAVVDAVPTTALPLDHPLRPLGLRWHAAWKTAQECTAVLGTDWPLLSDDGQLTVAIPEQFADGIVNLRELLNAAKAAGSISAKELAQHVGPVGVFRMYPERRAEQSQLPAGRAVLLSSVPLEILANQGLLKPVAKAFRVRILRSDLEQVTEEECVHEKRMVLADWTQEIVDRIKAGIAAGRYKVLPQSLPHSARVDRMGLDAKGLGNLLRAITENPQASLWCDDRSINRHSLAGSKPIVDILDVMQMLRFKGALSEATWYEKLTQLRRSNVRYVPTSTQEILASLRLAPIENGKVVETTDLATLRRYYAACLLERGRLVGPTQNGQHQDLQEWNLILQVRQATDTALRDLWEQAELATETVEAQANWLWQSLHIDLVGLRFSVVKDVAVDDVRELAALQVGSLFSLGVSVPFRPVRAGEPAARDRYFSWLKSKLLTPLEYANPGFIDSVGLVVGRDLERTCRETLKLPAGNRQKGELIVTGKLFLDLPQELREHVNLPADVLAGLGIKVLGPTIELEGHQFDFAVFSAAEAEAFANGSAKLVDRDRKVEWLIECVSAGTDLALKVTFGNGETNTWKDPEFAVLLPKEAERLDKLESLSFWFDCDRVTRRTAAQMISSLEIPVDRVRRLHEWKQGAPQVFYQELNRILKAGEKVSFDDLRIADWRRLVQHLRLSDLPSDAPTDLADGAATWLKEEGLSRALRCFMAMPRRLPECLEAAWRELPPEQAKDLWSNLPRFPRSVVADLHLVRLAHLRSDIDRSITEQLLRDLFDRKKSEALLDSFHAVLNWVERELNRWPQRHQLPPWRRLILVWYHASRLHGIFRATQVDLSQMEEWFRTNTPSWHHGVMDYDPAYARDLCHPSLAGLGNILINGLTQLMEDLATGDVDALGIPAKWKSMAAQDGRYCGSLLLDLCRRTDLASNTLDAFLANSSQSIRDRLLGTGWDAGLTLANANIPLCEIIAIASRDLYEVNGWSALLASLRELPVPEGDRLVLGELLTSVNYDTLAEKEPSWVQAVMNFAAAQARSIGSDFQLKIEEILLKFAGGPARAKMKPEAGQQCDMHILQSLLALSIEPADQAKTAANYFERIGKLIRISPSIAPLLDQPVRFWLGNLPFEQQRGLQALWYQVRALR